MGPITDGLRSFPPCPPPPAFLRALIRPAGLPHKTANRLGSGDPLDLPAQSRQPKALPVPSAYAHMRMAGQRIVRLLSEPRVPSQPLEGVPKGVEDFPGLPDPRLPA